MNGYSKTVENQIISTSLWILDSDTKTQNQEPKRWQLHFLVQSQTTQFWRAYCAPPCNTDSWVSRRMRRPATSQRVHLSKSPEEEISPSYHTIFGIKPVACVQWTHSSRPSLRRSNANPKSHFCARFQSHHSTPRNCSRTARRSYPGSRSLDVPAQGGLLSLRWGQRCRERNKRGKSLSAIWHVLVPALQLCLLSPRHTLPWIAGLALSRCTRAWNAGATSNDFG